MSTVVTEIEYPTSDGKPMAETQIHRENMVLLIEGLEDHYAGRTDVYVGGNMLMFYEQGNNRKHVAPDVFVVLGVSSRSRENYKIWEEAKPTLDLVIEVTSKTTRREDQGEKMELYRARLGVREYLLFDPFQEYLRPPQRLYRLTEEGYVEVAPRDGRLPSEVLELDFERYGQFLRLYDPRLHRRLLTRQERIEQTKFERDAAERERDAERQSRIEAEAKVVRLRAELEARKRNDN